MLVRKLSAAIRRQDWFQVLVEILIVVVGILIALQVDNWNDDRKARVQAEVWRQQIIADLNQNIRDLEGRLKYSQQALAFGEAALAGIEAADAPTGDAVWDTVLGAFQAGQIWPYRLTGPSYREVQSAGGLGLIGSERAQAALAYLYDVSAHDFELVSGGLPQYRQQIRERMPWPIQSHIWDSNCQIGSGLSGLALDFDQFELVRCAEPADKALMRKALDQLRSDAELQSGLRGRLSQLKVSASAIGRLVERARQVQALLQ